jgi:hypothetical protein
MFSSVSTHIQVSFFPLLCIFLLFNVVSLQWGNVTGGVDDVCHHRASLITDKKGFTPMCSSSL